MTSTGNLKTAALCIAICAGFVFQAHAQGRPPARQHTATQAQQLRLVSANQTTAKSKVSITTRGNRRVITANGIPGHKVGRFPNRGNPHRIRAQTYAFALPLAPTRSKTTHVGLGTLFGVAVNGVPFDPGAAEFWQGNRRSGWQYEALGGAVPLGLDSNYAHVQPNGAYHYHGLPVGLMQELGWTKSAPSPLIGHAADGFPIYALTAEIDGKTVKMTSSYRLKSGTRPGGSQPSGKYDGTFVQDYTYVAGAGTLDECNGAVVRTEDDPEGTYAYFLTERFPVIPRCLKGAVSDSFKRRRG